MANFSNSMLSAVAAAKAFSLMDWSDLASAKEEAFSVDFFCRLLL
jgi:hypothetical protein